MSDEETKAKSTSVSSVSSCAVSDPTDPDPSIPSIPIATIAKNRKLTLGEIQEVHDCSLIDGKLAFMVTLRGVDSVKGKVKVFKSDINTNSLRHAVPFAALCSKNDCANVKELEEKLAADKDRNETVTNDTPTIEITCDASTSLKQLASIASVVHSSEIECSDSSTHTNNDKADSDYTTGTTASQSPKPSVEGTTAKNTYNLRSKKRKFREIALEEEEDADHKNELNTNNNIAIHYPRPSALRPIPNTVSMGPTPSPTKNASCNTSLRNTVSAPNTPLLNANKRKQIINLVHSPSSIPKPLQFPNISLPQLQGNFTLLGPLKVLNKASIQQHNTMMHNNNNMNHSQRLNGISNLDPKALQQLQQLILLQKQLSLTQQNQAMQAPLPPLPPIANSNTTNGIITQITNLNPIQALPRLEADTCTVEEPPHKKAKLMALKEGQKSEPIAQAFWSERLRLDGILNTHKACLQQMARLNSMRSWTHIIRTLQGQRLELLKVQQSICVQWQNYHMEANRSNVQLNQILKQNAPKQREYKALKSAIDEYKKQITEIYEKISKLSVKRKVLERQMQSANQQMNKCQVNMQQVNAAAKQFKTFINDRKEKAIRLVEFIKTIDVISKEYCKSVEIMQNKVVQFEPEYEAWNSGEVVTWFENIDKGLLNKSESFLKFKAQLISNGVSGKDLINLNDFSLKMMGLKDDAERAVIVTHLNKLLIHSERRIESETQNNEEDDREHKTKNESTETQLKDNNDNEEKERDKNDGNEM